MIRGIDCLTTVDLVNIGVAVGVSVIEFARKIQTAVGYQGEIVLDTTKSDGACYKTVDGSKGKELLDWSPTTGLDYRLDKTTDWYMKRFKGDGGH